MSKNKSIEERYQKKSQIEHILLRPDTYIGSVEMHTQLLWIWNKERNRMVQKNITYVPGLYKIFDEIIVNAADVKAREKEKSENPMTCIKIEINKEQKKISVYNDGEGIPVEIHKEMNIYVPHMIFGELLTSDNYDDAEDRITGGRNGFGAKLTNIFSKEFVVQCGDSSRKKEFKMVWTDNMSKFSEPIIKNYNGKDFVRVTFKPDLAKFGMTEMDDDIESLLCKRVYDLAGTCSVRVYLNGNRLAIKDFKSYVDLYLKDNAGVSPGKGGANNNANANGNADGSANQDTQNPDVSQSQEPGEGTPTKSNAANGTQNNDEEEIVKIHEKQHRWEIVVSKTDGSQFQQVSFVNSICTTKGGSHVNYIVEQLLNSLSKKANAKNKGGMEIKSGHIKNHLWVFVNCLIVNPTFDSQTKETLTTKPVKFGSKCILSDKTINGVLKSSILSNILLWAQAKAQVELRKKMKAGSSKARERIIGIPKLEDANDAGSKHSQDCTLILTEGDSAKTSCLAGLSIVGRDKYGVFPLKGKLLNVRDASFKQLMDNKEIQNIFKIMGLDITDKNKEDIKGLRYGSLMIMTDQDYDGSHIKGLLINMIHKFWPSLLKHKGFLSEFVTPIVKVQKGNQEHSFFTIAEYEEWKESTNLVGWKIKYYKGLGTSTDKEFKQYFSDIKNHKIMFLWTGDRDGDSIDMAFSKKRIEDRKIWLQNFVIGSYVDHKEKDLSYYDFVNKELIYYSRYDTERSIPNIMDGWKPGQRKVLYGCFKRNLKNECKVAQLVGYIAEHSAYHHGESSLQQTIINMAQTFVGSNNINFLEPCGQFGSRKEGGKDASAARYIFTKLASCTRSIFNEYDDPILKYLNEEGQKIEPKYYIPVIPTILVNGCEGIGTGYSSFIPNYNYKDIIENIKRYINKEPLIPMIPWYKDFKGRIESNGKTGFETIGIIRKIDDETLEINELPIKKWTQDYKEFLEELLTDEKNQLILDYIDNSSHEEICFTIKMDPAKLRKAEEEGLEKVFKLKSTLTTTNMTLFDYNLKLQKYATELDILKEFCFQRLNAYENRKSYLIAKLEKEKKIISNKSKFILAIVNNELVVNKKKKKVLVEELYRKGYDPYKDINKIKKEEIFEQELLEAADNPEDNEEIIAGISVKDYDYLLSMPIFSLTLEKVEELIAQHKEKEKELEILRNITVETMWLKDIEKVEEAIEFQRNVELANREESNKFKVARKQIASNNRKKKKKKKLSSDEESSGDSSDSSEFLVHSLNIRKNRKPPNSSGPSSTTRKKLRTTGGEENNNTNNNSNGNSKDTPVVINVDVDNSESNPKATDDAATNLSDSTPLLSKILGDVDADTTGAASQSNRKSNKPSSSKNSRKRNIPSSEDCIKSAEAIGVDVNVVPSVNAHDNTPKKSLGIPENISISPNSTINVNDFSGIRSKLLELENKKKPRLSLAEKVKMKAAENKSAPAKESSGGKSPPKRKKSNLLDGSKSKKGYKLDSDDSSKDFASSDESDSSYNI
ncbi:DNA topoisomerase II, putative [Plasmodium knowlesi strain H]|uniref:DNA topoisomerase 2 n=3 Tax=Plasmodium knowlesi TaxID=5850 RepID=A0A5K1VUQ9_PLAKH|nr:DNA topoisomerase 2, putative [Plasmodium knowlesi strain H]OTN66727.1 DNA topoisomerase 2 [Plasmodium knowlesi]CAA9986839.1 DNA topoisomerase 2, putative [Plasmodium knowlesi strain H]SBO23687.1 DNA topoisomerase II, putative [Plasmodium knowlesi strain H]SBO25286.1 DNA topoisomerase II, putative [Plasmodium knowlesi strain H]VVS76313.1 DNA topoisomerase 2, putative [Plasmodium knowlesi strain H]|eukprot:XP_002260677.1 DNA topoisomerase II, putative [Plasmodium knowlesi strain H]